MTHTEFGRYLSRQRELRGLSRDEITRVTKIPPTLLEALEEGEVERLPGRVFVLRYVRAYAEVIGLEPNETVLRYEEVEPSSSEPAPTPRPALTTSRARRPWASRALLLLAAVGAMLLIAWLTLR